MRLRHLPPMLPGLIAACLLGLMPVSAHAQSGAAKPVADQAAALEERLIDLQVQIATVRSLARSVAPVAMGAAPQRTFQAVSSDAGSAQQIETLEGEVRLLSGQIKRLTGTPPLILPAATRARAPAPDNRPQPQGQPQGQTQGQTLRQPLGNIAGGGSQIAPQASAGGGWAGSTTVTPGSALQRHNQPATASVGEILPGTVYPGYNQAVPRQPAPTDNSVTGWAKPQLPAGAAPPSGAGDPETEYQTAYGYLLQQDYGAAQTAFKEFLERHPKTSLAGNAQYWIGETHYARGAYKNAAVAFLKGYETYGDGNKGADSLLKLGMSLGKLRQTAAACSSLRELGKRYRDAPETMLARAKTEMSRLRCK
jgi:tol-pal system protein YbgF